MVDGFSIRVYPNPSQRIFNLYVDGLPNQEIQITVVDGTGNKVYEAQGFTKRNYKFGENLANGIYYISVRKGDQYSSMKLIRL